MSTAAMNADSATRPSWGWLVVSSLWMLPILGTVGMLSWVGFIIVGVMNRRSLWVWFGAGYLFLAIVLLFAEWGEWRGTLGLLLWAVTVIHALVINPQHLRARWSARSGGAIPVVARTRPAHLPAAAPREPKKGRTWRRSNSAAMPARAAGLLDSPGTDAGDYLAGPAAPPATASSTEASSSERASRSSNATPSEVTPIDLNEASRRALERLPGMNRSRASRAVKERDARDGFSSVEEFCRVLELQPHEIARLRAAVFCSPKLRTLRGVGRKLDL